MLVAISSTNEDLKLLLPQSLQTKIMALKKGQTTTKTYEYCR